MAQIPTSLPSTSMNSLDSLALSAPPAPPVKPKRNLNKARLKMMKDYFETKTKNPTAAQLRELLAEIRNIPGPENAEYKYESLSSWFKTQRKPKKVKETPSVNALYPSLTPQIIHDLEVTYNSTPEPRQRSYEFWLTSATFEQADKADIVAWIQERDPSWNPGPLASTSTPQSPSTSTSEPKHRLHINTTSANGSSTGLPTPSDTTSPEPHFPPPISALSTSALSTLSFTSDDPSASGVQRRSTSASASARYHPYEAHQHYRPPTPSSRSPSVFKSEGNSPLMARLPPLPFPSSASNSPLVPRGSLPPASYAAFPSPFPPPYSPSLAASSSTALLPTPPPSALIPSTRPHIPPSPTIPPPTPLQSEPEPDFGTAALLAVLNMLKQEQEPDAEDVKVPMNLAEFSAMFEPHEKKIFSILDHLKKINHDPPS